MKKIIIILILSIILSSCATSKYSTTYRQKQGLMLLDNTEMSRNKKYHEQKRKKGIFNSRKNARKYYKK
jgi:hypothetical protein